MRSGNVRTQRARSNAQPRDGKRALRLEQLEARELLAANDELPTALITGPDLRSTAATAGPQLLPAAGATRIEAHVAAGGQSPSAQSGVGFGSGTHGGSRLGAAVPMAAATQAAGRLATGSEGLGLRLHLARPGANQCQQHVGR